MACLKCWCITKMKTCCCICCSISCCIVGLGWGTFLIIMSVTYEMNLVWKILTFSCGFLVFLTSLVVLSLSLNELFKKYKCWCQRYSMDGKSGDLSIHEQSESANRRRENIFKYNRKQYYLVGENRQSKIISDRQESSHDLSPSSVLHNLENNGENMPQHCVTFEPRIDHLLEDIPLQSYSRQSPHRQAGIRRKNFAPAAAMCSTPQKRANLKFALDMPDLHTQEQTQNEVLTTSVSPHRKHLRPSTNLQEAFDMSFTRQREINEILMEDLTISSNSDPEFHIYQNINSSYEEECIESDYEFIESLPPPRMPRNTLHEALTATDTYSQACMNAEVLTSDAKISTEDVA